MDDLLNTHRFNHSSIFVGVFLHYLTAIIFFIIIIIICTFGKFMVFGVTECAG